MQSTAKGIIRLLLAVVIFTASIAHAATCYRATATYNGTDATRVTTSWLPDPQQVCNALAAGIGAYDWRAPWTGTYNGSCAMYGNAGQSFGNYGNFSTQECANPDNCAANTGARSTVNFTTGWARSGVKGAVDHVGTLLSPFEGGTNGERPNVCQNKCRAKPENIKDCYRSQVAGPNGLHRISCDIEYEVQGSAGMPGDTCSEATNTQAYKDAVSPNTPPLPCPGATGQVQGKTVCVPMSSGGNGFPPPSGPLSPAPEDGGNPTAGPKPGIGEGSGTGGSGRTPTAGTGTATGGPSSAAGSGSSATGNTPKPGEGEEQQNCGAPGQPQCKIDETGTPSPVREGTALDGINDEAETTKDGLIGEIEKARTGPTWTWTFQLPTGCTALQLPAFAQWLPSIDICEWQPMIHDILSIVWIAATIFAIFGMASRSINAPS